MKEVRLIVLGMFIGVTLSSSVFLVCSGRRPIEPKISTTDQGAVTLQSLEPDSALRIR
jgi:hypothetical protein